MIKATYKKVAFYNMEENNMKNFSTWLLVMFIVMFWIYRIIVAVTFELGYDFGGVVPMDMKTEVILLFIVLVCLLFIVKRKIIGAVMYTIAYDLYFGVFLFKNLSEIINGNITISNSMNAFVSLIGVLLPLMVLIDLLLDRNRKANPVDKKTDWYYKDDKYDRQMDERADKNNYRTL